MIYHSNIILASLFKDIIVISITGKDKKILNSFDKNITTRWKQTLVLHNYIQRYVVT